MGCVMEVTCVEASVRLRVAQAWTPFTSPLLPWSAM